MQNTFVLGDVHGAFKALKQVLEKSNFDYEKDFLISLGDICDGWSETADSFEELLKIKNLIFIRGNHDEWFLDYVNNLLDVQSIQDWKEQGGLSTLSSYQKNPDKLQKHLNFIKSGKKFYTDEKNRVFTHAGIENRYESLNRQIDYSWNRTFFKNANVWHKQKFKLQIAINHLDPTNLVSEWFVGHTPVSNFKFFKENVPMRFSNITFCDTGAAFDGCLTLMNLESLEIFQSDIVRKLYPNEKGRNLFSYNEENKENKLW